MAWVYVGARNGLRGCLLSLAAIATALTMMAMPPSRAVVIAFTRITVTLPKAHDPPFASIVVDGNNAAVLQRRSRRFSPPGLLTKSDDALSLVRASRCRQAQARYAAAGPDHASAQDPTKLGLKPGQTHRRRGCDQRHRHRSANDAAVVIAEYLGGSEDAFAKLMTQKAHALGMAHTTYVNASGLPDDDQITTAATRLAGARHPGQLSAFLPVLVDAASNFTARPSAVTITF